MTIATTKTVITYSGNGASTVFAYDFLIPSTDDLRVYLTLKSDGTETDLSASDYSITGIDDPAGGNVTYPLSGSPLSALYRISIERSLDLVQPTVIQNQGNLFADTVEEALDRLTMMMQQIGALYDRSIRVPMSSDEVDALPDASVRANMSLLFDANGDPTVGAISTVAVSAVMVAVVSAATLAAARVAFTTAYMATLLDDTDASSARSTLGLGGTVALTSDTNRKLRFANTLARLNLTT